MQDSDNCGTHGGDHEDNVLQDAMPCSSVCIDSDASTYRTEGNLRNGSSRFF